MVQRLKLTVCLAIIGFTSHAQWNNCGGNPQKNGFVNVAGPTQDTILWEVNSPGYFGIPAFIDNELVVTMRFLSLTYAPLECYNLNTGDLLWSNDVTGQAEIGRAHV